jgi:hypothetical protein
LPEMQIILLVGLSGSGKTTIAKKIVEDSRVPFCIVNGDQSDFPASDRTRHLSWDECGGLSQCGVIFEDVVNAKKEEFVTLKNLACVSAHHSSVTPIIIICHAVLGNNLYGILANLTHVFVTLAKGNIKSLLSVLEYYRVTPREREAMERTFLSCEDEFGHFVYDVGRRTLEQGGAAAAGKAASAQKKSHILPPQRFLELMPRPREATLLFDLIYPSLPKAATSGGNYTLTLKNSASGEPVKINFMDYINCLVDEKKVPSRQMKSVHSFVTRILPLPRCIVPNKHFLRAV